MRYDNIPKLSSWINDTSILRKSATGSVLKKLDGEIDNYHKALVAMTKRNLLTDIKYCIRDWEKIHYAKVSRHPNVLALKEVVTRKFNELSPSTFKYRQVTCLSFNIGCNENPDKYFRFSDKDPVDMGKKCIEMMEAIKQARAQVVASGTDNDQTLKIFMAPEFYFRGANGAYSFDLVSQIIPKLQALGTSGDEYKHWLFIFGTAIAASKSEITFCKVCGPKSNTVQLIRDTACPDSKGFRYSHGG